MNSMNRNLIANTEVTNAVAQAVKNVSKDLETLNDNFDAHTKAEEALVNKGKGAWTIVAGVIGIVQVLGLLIWNSASADLKAIHASIHGFEIADATLDKRITVLEKSAK